MLGYTLTLTRNTNVTAIIRGAMVDVAKIVMKSLLGFIPQFTPSLENQQRNMKRFFN